MITLIVSLWLKNEDITGFEAFEGKAATIMARHGGKIERAIRLENPSDDRPFEVHVLTFPDAQAFAAYRADPALTALAEMRQQVIARTTGLGWTGCRGLLNYSKFYESTSISQTN